MSNYLEIDSKILEKNLLLKSDSEDFENFLRSPETHGKDNTPWKIVTPTAGFCVKTTDSENRKVFINVCKLNDIPEPRDITEAQLLEMWQSDEVPDYRIPLSIQEPHDEFDKSGKPTVVYDVAVNSNFFQKIQTNLVFQSFVMQVILEGLENKYGVQLKKEGFIILQNKKQLGELRAHRIRIGKGDRPAVKPLIEELPSSAPTLSSKDNKPKPFSTPDFRIFQDNHLNHLIGEFHLPNVVNIKDLTLDVGEKRIVVESRRGSYLADLFVPFDIDESKALAKFNISTKILTVNVFAQGQPSALVMQAPFNLKLIEACI